MFEDEGELMIFPRATRKIRWVKAEIVFRGGGDLDDVTTPPFIKYFTIHPANDKKIHILLYFTSTIVLSV